MEKVVNSHFVDETTLNNNIDTFSKLNPTAGVQLNYLDLAGTEFTKTTQGELNLRVDDGNGEFYLYPASGALKEQNKWKDHLKLESNEVLIIFGIGLGYAFDVLSDWLEENPENVLVFFEMDLRVIHRFLEINGAAQILEHPRVYLHYIDLTLEVDPFYNWLSWRFYQRKVHIEGLDSYKKRYSILYDQLKRLIEYDIATKLGVIKEFCDYGVGFYKNFYANLMELPKSYRGSCLFDKFTGIPAIICGAGPSLKKNLPLLKTLNQHALIFAGGSALNALSAQSFLPHFAAGVDPNIAQFERLISNSAFEVPFFYRSRMNRQAFNTIHGPRLYLGGSNGYRTAEWFDEKLGIPDQEIDEGHNVINFCMDVARILGCNPIILVGMDLAYTNQRSYAPGVVSEAEAKVSIKDDEDLQKRKGIDGKTVYTSWKWISEAKWITQFAEMHPELNVLNATEGGLGFERIPNISLQQAKDQYLIHSYDLNARVHTEIMNAQMPDLTSTKIRALMNDMFASLQRSDAYLQKLIEDLDVVKSRIQKDAAVVNGLHTGQAALYEIELGEEPAYVAILDLFNQVIQHLLNAEYQEIMHGRIALSETEKKQKLIDLNKRKYQFLRNVAQSNAILLGKALQGEPL